MLPAARLPPPTVATGSSHARLWCFLGWWRRLVPTRKLCGWRGCPGSSTVRRTTSSEWTIRWTIFYPNCRRGKGRRHNGLEAKFPDDRYIPTMAVGYRPSLPRPPIVDLHLASSCSPAAVRPRPLAARSTTSNHGNGYRLERRSPNPA